MIGTAKVKPDSYRCRECFEEQMSYNVHIDCNKCSYNNRACAILEIKDTFFGAIAIVFYEDNSSLEKVPLDRLRDVKLKEVI